MLWSEVERGARLRDLKMSLQFTNKWSNLECSRVLKVTILNNPRRVKLWVLARLKSPPTMNRLLERRWDVEVIKVSKKEVTWEWETFGGMYTLVIIIWLNLDKHGDLHLTVRASIEFMSYDLQHTVRRHDISWSLCSRGEHQILLLKLK